MLQGKKKKKSQTGFITVFQGAFTLQALAVVHKQMDSVAVPVSGIPTPPSSSYSLFLVLFLFVLLLPLSAPGP